MISALNPAFHEFVQVKFQQIFQALWYGNSKNVNLEIRGPGTERYIRVTRKNNCQLNWVNIGVVPYQLPHLIVLQHWAGQSAISCIFLHEPGPDMGFDAAP